MLLTEVGAYATFLVFLGVLSFCPLSGHIPIKRLFLVAIKVSF